MENLKQIFSCLLKEGNKKGKCAKCGEGNLPCSKGQEKDCCYYYARRIDAPSAKDFIFQYFQQGEKNQFMREMQELASKIEYNRFEHMKSVFLLGIYFYDQIRVIRESVNKLIYQIFLATKKRVNDSDDTVKTIYNRKKLKQADCRQEFLYLWYLICLFHDFGYPFEKNSAPQNEQQETEKKLSKKYLAQYHKKNILGIPHTLQEQAADYFFMLLNCPVFSTHQKADHGACGGIIMLEKMQDLMKEKIGTNNWEKDIIISSDLLWGKPIYDNYIISAAWCIVCHNIWTKTRGNPDDADGIKKYSSLGFSDLITSTDHPIITLHDHPLLFLLCLIDTLDPIKMFCLSKENESSAIDKVQENVFICSKRGKDELRIEIILSDDILPCRQGENGCKKTTDSLFCSPQTCYKKLRNDLAFLTQENCFSVLDGESLQLIFNTVKS